MSVTMLVTMSVTMLVTMSVTMLVTMSDRKFYKYLTEIKSKQ